MNSTNRFVSLVLGLLICPPLFAAQTLDGYIDQQLAPLKASKTAAGIVILDPEDGQTIYAFNPDLPLAPASNQKLPTTIAALTLLGPDYQFTTTLGIDNGDLVVIGDGDPGFGDPGLPTPHLVTDIFDQWAKDLAAAGIKEVPGKIIFDDTVFDREFVHPNWPANQLNRWYTAPVAGLNLNDNCLDLTVEVADKKARISVVPETETFTVEPQWIPTRGKRTIIHPRWEDPWKLKVKITLGSRGAGPENITIMDPPMLFAAICRERLEKGGITIKGPVAFRPVRKPDGTLPETVRVIARHRTPIMDVVNRANKDSQNFFAECLFKRLGYQSARQHASYGSGTWTTGQLAVKEFLQDQLKVPIDDLVIDDGAGLSKHNRVSAAAIARLLYFAAQRPWGAQFRESLAIAGTDGTLKRRMRNTPAAGKVHAKTGFIAGVSALSGYVMGNDDRPAFIFSMLFNNFRSGNISQYKAIEDRICTVLAKLSLSRPRQSTEQETHEPGQATQ